MKKIINSAAKVSYVYHQDDHKHTAISNSNSLDIDLRLIDLQIQKFASKRFFKPGDEINYTIIITNTGNYCAEEIIVIDDLNNLTIHNDSAIVVYPNEEKKVLLPLVDGDKVVFEIDYLEPYSSLIINYSATANNDIALENNLQTSASVYAKRVNQLYSNKTDVRQEFANIICTKTASKDFVYNYDRLDLLLTLTNTGNITAKNIHVEEKLPNYFTLCAGEEAIIIDKDIEFEYEYNEAENTLLIMVDELSPVEKELTITIKGEISI